MSTLTKERSTRRVKTMHASQDVLTFAGRESDECPLCAMYDYTPNAETIEAIRETHDKHNLHKYSLDEMLSDVVHLQRIGTHSEIFG